MPFTSANTTLVEDIAFAITLTIGDVHTGVVVDCSLNAVVAGCLISATSRSTSVKGEQVTPLLVLVGIHEHLKLSLTRQFTCSGDLHDEDLQIRTCEGRVRTSSLSPWEWGVPRSTSSIVDRHTGTRTSHELGRSIDITPNCGGVLSCRRRGIFSTNGEEAVKRQVWEEPQERRINSLSVPCCGRSIVVPILSGVDDQWIAAVSRARGQVISLVETVEVEAVGRLTIQHSAGMRHNLLHGDTVTLRSWCKDTGRQELSLKPRHTQRRKGSEKCTHSDNRLV